MERSRPTLDQRLAAFSAARAALGRIRQLSLHGQVESAGNVSFSVSGLSPWLRLGTRLALAAPPGEHQAGPQGAIEPGFQGGIQDAMVPAEVVALRGGLATALALGPLDGLGPGTPAHLAPPALLAPDDTWLGRVLDPLGRPLDGRGPLRPGPAPRP
ncbi:hypothetical protein E2C05_30090, partial [Paracraurococcus ruber]